MFIDLPPVSPTVEVSVANQGVSKGVLEESGVQVVGGIRFDLGKHMYVIVQGKNVDTEGAGAELKGGIGAKTVVHGVELKGEVAHKHLTDAPAGVDADAFEFTAGAKTNVGPVVVGATAVYSPNDFGATKDSLYLEGTAAVEVAKGTTISGGVGRRNRDGAKDYTAFNAGVTQELAKGVEVDVRYYDTAQNEYGRTFKDRVVAALRLKF